MCKPGYYLDLSTSEGCVSCASLGCYACNKVNDVITCSGCVDGYRLDTATKKCVKCVTSQCRNCDYGVCTSCVDGFFIKPSSNDQWVCASCA